MGNSKPTDEDKPRQRPAPPRVLRARHRFNLPQGKFARVVGVSTRTLAKLEHGQEPTEQVKRQITQIERLYRALTDVVNADVIGRWMQQPNDAFEGLRPIEVIERGQIDRLWAMIYDLRSGSPV